MFNRPEQVKHIRFSKLDLHHILNTSIPKNISDGGDANVIFRQNKTVSSDIVKVVEFTDDDP